VGVNLSLDWQATDHSELQFGTGLGYLDYLKYTGNNGVEISPNSALTYAISLDEVTLTAFEQLGYSREVRTEAALANITTQPQFNNNAGLRAAWSPGHWMLSASYSHADYVSDHANDYLNRSAENFLASAGWRFAEATQVGIEASDALTRYQVSGQGNNQNVSVGGFVDWQVRPCLHFSLRGGPVFYEPESGSAGTSSTLNTYYVSLAASHQLTDYLAHSLNIQRSLQAGANQGSSHLEQFTANYTISWTLTQRITVSVSANYVDGQQSLAAGPISRFPIPAVLANENYQQYAVGLGSSWRCTDHLAISLNFNHWLRNSDLPDRSYSDNSVALQMNYAF